MQIEHERHKKFPFRLKAAALLVIDIQDYFTKSGSHAFIPSSLEIIPRINDLIAAFKKARRPVVFTRHVDIDQRNIMSRWWEDRIEGKDPLSRLNANLNTSYGKTIIKHQYDAFMDTGLEELLKKDAVEQVVITGVVAHLCCETTARSSFMRDFETFFVIDGTASLDPEHHKAAVFNLAHGFAVPITCSELLKVIPAKAGI